MTLERLISPYGTIEEFHGDRPWGKILDAGTGPYSLRFLTQLDSQSWTAVTAKDGWEESLVRQIQSEMRPEDRVVWGNWNDPDFLRGQVFDVVLVDYLVGALEMFSPYFASQLFARLKPHTGGVLYFHGQEPEDQMIDHCPCSELFSLIIRLRDACFLLNGGRRYYEYPSQWVVVELEKAGFKIQRKRTHSLLLYKEWIAQQIKSSRHQLDTSRFQDVVPPLHQALDALSRRVSALKPHEMPRSTQYIISAVPQ